METKKTKTKRKKAGRPTVMTPEVIRKIEEVAALDGTVEEMAMYAGINPDTIYDHLKKNLKFSDRIKSLRQRPILKARQTVVKGIEHNYNNAMDYLKRKRKSEFGDNVQIDGVNFSPTIVLYGEDDPLKDVMERRSKKL